MIDGFETGANMKGMAFCVASWAHFVIRSLEAGHVLRDQKARILEASPCCAKPCLRFSTPLRAASMHARVRDLR